MAELAEQIDSHMVVIDVENLAPNVILKGQGTPEVYLGPSLPIASEISSATLAVTQGPIPWRY